MKSEQQENNQTLEDKIKELQKENMQLRFIISQSEEKMMLDKLAQKVANSSA